MRIKVCGLTRTQDVDAAVAAGVDALGFVVWPHSPRAVTLETLSVLLRGLPPFVTAVAVTVDPTRDEVRRLRDAGCGWVQVHGVVPDWPDGCRLLRAISWNHDLGTWSPDAGGEAAVLIDAHDPVRHGGTGRTADWTRAAALAKQRAVVLAGGLTPETVGDAVRAVQPWAVDVSSGVEEAPGLKSAARIAAFVAAARREA
jgi:phosphoribosylanthranilate isomerase